MGNIKVFDTPSLGLRPSETGIDATAGNARRMGAFYNQQAGALEQLGADEASAYRSVGRGLGTGLDAAGDAAVNYLDHKEISAGAAKGTELMANLTDQWNEIAKTADPNDPTVKQKFMHQVLEPQLQKFVNGDGDSGSFFTTEKSQQFAEQFVDRFRQHMENKTSADMSTLAGIALKTNVQTTVNSLSSMVANDPSSLDFALSQADHAIGAKVNSSPTLDADTAASVRGEVGLKAKQDIVRAAVVGMIQKNPNVDLDGIQKKYGEYISGAEFKMFQKTAQVQARVDSATAKQNVLLQKQIDEQNVHAASNKIMTDNVSIDPQSGRPVIRPQFFNDALDIARKYPNAPNAANTARTLMDWAESQQNKETRPVDDPATRQALTDRLFSADNPTTRIDLMKAQIDGKLGDHTFQTLDRLVQELQTSPLKGEVWKNTTTALKARMIRSDLPEGKDATGMANYASFMASFIPQYLAKSRDGTLAPNALDLRDPNSMISQAIKPYERSMQTNLRTATEAPAEQPARPNTPAALRGIASLSYSKSRNMFRDDTTGKIYRADGSEVK